MTDTFPLLLFVFVDVVFGCQVRIVYTCIYYVRSRVITRLIHDWSRTIRVITSCYGRAARILRSSIFARRDTAAIEKPTHDENGINGFRCLRGCSRGPTRVAAACRSTTARCPTRTRWLGGRGETRPAGFGTPG